MNQNEIKEIAQREVDESNIATRRIRRLLIKNGILMPSVRDNY